MATFMEIFRLEMDNLFNPDFFHHPLAKDLPVVVVDGPEKSHVMMDFGPTAGWDTVYGGSPEKAAKWVKAHNYMVAKLTEARTEAAKAEAAKAEPIRGTYFFIERVCSECGAPAGLIRVDKAAFDEMVHRLDFEVQHNEFFELTDKEVYVDNTFEVALDFVQCPACRNIF